MANVYGGGGVGSGVYGGGRKDAGDGFFDFFVNLGQDIKDLGVGIAPGVASLFRKPYASKESARGVTESFKAIQTHYAEESPWGPLFTGDPGVAWNRFKQHPLSPILDVAAVYTGGGALVGVAGRTGKLGRTLKSYSSGKDIDIGVRAAGGLKPFERMPKNLVEEVVYKHLSRNPATRMRQEVNMKLAEHLKKAWPYLQDPARFERGLIKNVAGRRRSAAYMARLATRTFFDGAKNLTDKWEINALGRKVYRELHWGLRNHAMTIKAFPPTQGGSARSRIRKDNAQHLPDGFLWLKDSTHMKHQHFTKENFEGKVGNFGRQATTRDPLLAMRDAQRNFFVVPRHAAKRFSQEAADSQKFLTKFYHNTTHLWRWLILTPPRYVVNNTVGTAAMHMFTVDPAAALGGVLDGIRAHKGTRKVNEFLDEGIRLMNQGPIGKWYLNVHEGISADFIKQLEVMPKGKTKAARAINIASKGLFPLTNKIEQAIRGVTAKNVLLAQPEVRELMRQGMSWERAADTVSDNPAIRSRVATEIENRLGQYYHYNSLERQVREIRPFYGWDRAILRHTRNLTGPRKALLDELSQIGQVDAEALYGEFAPDYIKAIIQLGEEGESKLGIPGMPGRTPGLSTFGMNPYAALASLSGVALGQKGEFLEGVNPWVTGLIAAVTGRNPVTNAPLAVRSPIPGVAGIPINVVSDVLENLQQSQLVKAAIGQTSPTYTTGSGVEQPFLSSKQWQEILAGLLGVPIRQVSGEAVERQTSREKARRLGQI